MKLYRATAFDNARPAYVSVRRPPEKFIVTSTSANGTAFYLAADGSWVKNRKEARRFSSRDWAAKHAGPGDSVEGVRS